jgi:4-amino-4-deoxy-L-arabinose transferase-like glycosyltransferase
MSDSEIPETPAETTPLALPAPIAPPGFLARLARRPLLWLTVLGLLLWLPGLLSLPPLDRDESRFAQSSRQMVETGNLVDIRLGQVPRYKKPIGIYWLQAASTVLLGVGDDSRIWTYRLPSLLGAIAAARLTVWCAAAFLEAEAALMSGLLMLSSVLLTAEATIATTDAVLLAFTLVVQGGLLRVYRAARDLDAPRPSTRLILLGWAAVGAGALVKFPVVPGVAVATAFALIAWDRKVAWLNGIKPVCGFFLALLVALPWMIAITIQSHGQFLEQSLGNDFAAKLAGGQESHGLPPGVYLALAAATFFPAILFVMPGIAVGLARRGEPAVRFLLAWAGSWWLVVEAVPTKLPHYVLPAYPPLAILGAVFITATPPPAAWLRGWLTAARAIAALQFLVGAGLFMVALVMLPRLYGAGDWWPLLAAAGLGAVLVLAALVLTLYRAYAWGALVSLLAMLIFVPAVTTAMAPRLPQLWMTERLKPLAQANTQPGDPPLALAGYQEPSMLFAFGKDVLLTDGSGAADAGAKSGGLALVEDAEQGAFLARLAELQADAAPVGDLRGFNYSRGRRQHVTLYRVAPLHELH